MIQEHNKRKQKYTLRKWLLTPNDWTPESPINPHLTQFIHTHQKGGILWII